MVLAALPDRTAADPERDTLAHLVPESVTGRAAAWITSRAQQVHGGIGFTWEHVPHLYLRRAKVNERSSVHPPRTRCGWSRPLAGTSRDR